MSNPETSDGAAATHVVCLGASAGGLDALERFFDACPPDTGAAFVVVQHLSPDHKSMMSSLLARHTRMPVAMVEDEMPIRPDHVYLIPPGSLMHVSPGVLHLTPKNPRGLTLPIDVFMASLAQAYRQQAVGIVLSGTGSDGSRGAAVIKEQGGLLLAQEPESARFDGMPRSVIATGLVDAVLPVDDMPARLLAHLSGQPVPSARALPLLPDDAELTPDEARSAILLRLREHCGVDFEEYKPATVARRIERRMQQRHVSTLQAYAHLLQQDSAELQALRAEMLIPVTSFFRDPETFELLADKVITPLVQQRQTGETIRVWIAGVATGEEAYTVAMLFLEAFERERRWPQLKIFATDVDQGCIDAAGAGLYPQSAATELTPERLARYFVPKGQHYAVKSELRQCVVFARHNLLTDPPFTKMDLVACRNTLIYFKAKAQERALHSLQYALVAGGALLLGSSESLVLNADSMQVIHARHKLFRSTALVGLPVYDRQGRGAASADRLAARPVVPVRARRRANDLGLGDDGAAMLLSRYAPPALLVSAHHEVLHLYGDAASFLQPRVGVASLELERMLPEPLVPVATALLFRVAQDRESLRSAPVDFTPPDGRVQRICLAAHPISSGTSAGMVLLCFESPEARGATDALRPIDIDAETVARVGLLEQELAATRESLQATIEELETSNEELQATNEELMASNEELQSANEELQSVNEEMSTVNAEFQEKMLILNRVNADLDNMAKAAGVATVFVDDRLVITRFSPDATQIFRLRDADVGRPLEEITHTLDYPLLMDDLARTLKGGRMVEREVRSADHARTFLLRILPYVIQSSMQQGVVATLVDVTSYRNAERLQAIIDALPEHIAVLDPAGTILMVNEAWNRFALANGGSVGPQGSGPAPAPGGALGVGSDYLAACGVDAEAAPADEGSADAVRGIRAVLGGELPSFSLEYPCHSPTEQRWFVMNVAPVRLPGVGAVVSHVNVTALRQRPGGPR